MLSARVESTSAVWYIRIDGRIQIQADVVVTRCLFEHRNQDKGGKESFELASVVFKGNSFQFFSLFLEVVQRDYLHKEKPKIEQDFKANGNSPRSIDLL